MALQGYEFRTMMDEGRYFRLIKLNDGWRNYDPTQGDAGWTTGKVADYEIGSRFLMVKLVRSVGNASNGKSYELMEVIFDKDLEKSEEEQVVYMWGIVEDRQYVQSEVPDLKAGDSGINVVTLQLWLKMLGFEPGSVNGQFHEPTKAALNEFRVKKSSVLDKYKDIKNPAGVLVGRDAWYAMDDLLKKRLPPDPEELERLPFPRRSNFTSDDDYQVEIAIGLRKFGFPVFPGEFDIEDLETLRTELKNKMSDETFRSRLIENNKKAIKLFKAISRGIDLYEDRNGKNRFPRAITDQLEETTYNIDGWENFNFTWGAFYGAPWMGILLDPPDGMVPGESNWGTYDTISMLYEWGRHYLGTSNDSAELSKRLNKPIPICRLSNTLGGKIESRDDISQTGQSAESNFESYEIDWQKKIVIAFQKVSSYHRLRVQNEELIEENV